MTVYLGIEGVTGGVTAPGHEGEFELLAWTPNRAGERDRIETLSATRYTDRVSPVLMSLCWSGRQIPRATLRNYRSDGRTGSKPELFLEVVMERVVLSNFAVSSGAGDVPVETLTFECGSIQYNYKGLRSSEPQGVTATPLPRSSEPPVCTVTLPGAADALPIPSWSLKQDGAFTFAARLDDAAAESLRKSEKAIDVTVSCGGNSAFTLTGAKVAAVSSQDDLTTVSLAK